MTEPCFGAFWERKISSWVKRIDYDQDGAISERDFEGIADRYRDIGGADAARVAKIRGILREIWTTYFAEAARLQPVTAQVYCSSLRQYSKEKLVEVCHTLFPHFFDIINTNDDGKIQKSEFEIFYKIFGMDPSTAAESFAVIATNHSGFLSREEFVAASVDFCTSDDEKSPFKIFFGPLI